MTKLNVTQSFRNQIIQIFGAQETFLIIIFVLLNIIL